ncbi:acyl-CoA oxidase [Stipitochalara longipes BDJ]|nr:acyl-CoA oxidase [Stipitochalara longipes BDJ]
MATNVQVKVVPNIQTKMMVKARSQASFDPKKMAEVIHGNSEALERHNAAFQRVEQALGVTDNMKLPPIYGSMNREELLLDGFKAGKVVYEDGVDNNCDVFEFITHHGMLANASPFGLMRFLFIPPIKLLATDVQIAEWVSLAETGKIIGSYAQTELGHGTQVRGIETTATFDKETDEFIIHSPTLSSTKYWPGALGCASTHTLLMACMIIDGKDLGVHAFIVQIRSLEDFKTLPGIELGDIGMKMAYNGTDNGYAIFDHVRIPRTNLLMRHCQVTRDGRYAASPLRQKLAFGGMLSGRAIIIRAATFQLARALTIATRYSVVRQQGTLSSLGESTAIIAYKHQHFRLLSLIAKSYISLLAWKSASTAFLDLKSRQERGDHSTLPYLHMLTCGLKAWSTQTAADGAEEARKMCGGHGYLAMSGLPGIVTSVTATCTFEGENFVMWGQVAKYLLKGFDAAELPADMAYMREYETVFEDKEVCCAEGQDLLTHDALGEIFQYRAATLARDAHAAVNASEAAGMSRLEAENEHALQLHVAARAHIELFILNESIKQSNCFPASTPDVIKTIIGRLISLFALTAIANPLSAYSSSFLEHGYINSSHLKDMRQLIDDLLELLLPDAIALTDAWSFSDASLASALGCRDGDVYNRLLAWTRQLPINIEAGKNGGVVKKGWEESIRPFLTRDLPHLVVKARL